MDKCPVCGSEITPGYITNKSSVLAWSDYKLRKNGFFKDRFNVGEDQIRLAKFKIKTGWTVDTPHCKQCGLIFINTKKELK